ACAKPQRNLIAGAPRQPVRWKWAEFQSSRRGQYGVLADDPHPPIAKLAVGNASQPLASQFGEGFEHIHLVLKRNAAAEKHVSRVAVHRKVLSVFVDSEPTMRRRYRSATGRCRKPRNRARPPRTGSPARSIVAKRPTSLPMAPRASIRASDMPAQA